ncbi:MAG: hypothetical protein H7322_17205 [Ramlibacter sp.]|nr:hypothetical protein [Ramlibacter sp.]
MTASTSDATAGALDPLLYHWPRDTVMHFDDAIAVTAIDVVYLGAAKPGLEPVPAAAAA